MVKTFRARFEYPTRRVAGGNLNPADIAGCEVSVRVGGAPLFTVLDTVIYPDTEFVQTEVAFGNYEFSFVCVLANGQRSAPVVLSVLVADDSAPQPMSNVTFTIE